MKDRKTAAQNIKTKAKKTLGDLYKRHGIKLSGPENQTMESYLQERGLGKLSPIFS